MALSVVGVLSSICTTHGPVVSSAILIYSIEGDALSQTSIHYGLTFIIVRSILSHIYLANAKTFLSSGMDYLNGGVVYCTSQRTLMYGSRFSIYYRICVRLDSGNVASHSSWHLGGVPSFSFRRSNNVGKVINVKSP